MVAITPALRFAVFTVWPPKCVWGHEPITFKEMEVDHIIPKSLKGDELATVLDTHGLSSDFDLEAEENLAPTCGACNGNKSFRRPPASPGIKFLLEEAAERAGAVRTAVSDGKMVGKVSKALGQMLASDPTHPATLAELKEAAAALGAFIESAAPSIERVKLTSVLGLVDRGGEWFAESFSGFGDCPNRACMTGDVRWERYPDGSGELEAGACDTCGTFAVRCPDCGEVTGAFFDEFPCSGCGATFDLVRDRDAGEVEEVAVTRPPN